MSEYTVDLDGDLYYVSEWATGKRLLAQGFTMRAEAQIVASLFTMKQEVEDRATRIDVALALKDRTPRARSVAVKRG